ncbi:hypothetical protein PFISCL1PPCAC_28561, partial [Pristionchus fissidentatus]
AIVCTIPLQMGGDHSKSAKSPPSGGNNSHSQSPPSPPTKTVSPIWQQRLHLLTDGAEQLTRAHFDQFGEEYGEKLWQYFANDGQAAVPLEQFAAKANPLFGSSTDVYVKLVGGGEELLRIGGSLVDCAPNDADEIYQNVVDNLKSFGADWNAAVEWKHCEAPRAADPLQLRFHAAFSTIPVPSVPQSHIVSPFCMFFLRSSIPSGYLPPQNYEWSILYSSVTSGMSTSRFESCVFGYKSRTLTLIRTARGLFAVGADQEWRHSLSAFGGAETFCIRLAPAPITRHSGANSLFCNMKLRASKMGISWKGGDLDLDKDLSQVLEMEVWACGGSKHLEEHAKLKVWQKNQTEKNKKVPLPGNWDD